VKCRCSDSCSVSLVQRAPVQSSDILFPECYMNSNVHAVPGYPCLCGRVQACCSCPCPQPSAQSDSSLQVASAIAEERKHWCGCVKVKVSILITESIISSTLAATGAATDVATTSLIMAPTRYQEARGDQNLRERKLHSCLVRRLCQDGGERFVAKLGAWEEIVFSFASSMRRDA
jgi:hypothetical protein